MCISCIKKNPFLYIWGHISISPPRRNMSMMFIPLSNLNNGSNLDPEQYVKVKMTLLVKVN